MDFAPIVIFAYNRPDYLKETLEALSNNKEVGESDVYIYCDGPKANSDKKSLDLIEQVRTLAHSQKLGKKLYIRESESNKGLSKSIVTGVSEIVNLYGRVIVLEDDIVVAPFFLRYMNDALERYKDDDEVASISGYNLPIGDLITDRETFFLRLIGCWGWATWKRAWGFYDGDAIKLLMQIQATRQEKEFNVRNSYRYIRMLKMTIAGKVDSWAVRWYASIFLLNKLTLFPRYSMVKNIGMVGTNIVGDNRDFLGDKYYDGMIKNFETSIIENEDVKKAYVAHYNYFNRRKLNYRNVKYAVSKIKMKYNLS